MISGSSETILSESDTLEYFFKKYFSTVKRGRPNLRAAKQLKTIIDTIQITEAAKIFNHNIVGGTGEKRIFKIDVSNISENEIEGYLRELKEKMTTPLVDPQTGQLNITYKPLPFDKDYYL